MTTSLSRSAYSDCFDLFDRACESPQGIRNRCVDQGAAYQLKVRLHYARSAISRGEAREIYAEDHPSYGVSPYDPYIVRIRFIDDAWWVYIEPRTIKGIVEELNEAKPERIISEPIPELEIKAGVVEVIKRRKIA